MVKNTNYESLNYVIFSSSSYFLSLSLLGPDNLFSTLSSNTLD
jgi:hypothetical protein